MTKNIRNIDNKTYKQIINMRIMDTTVTDEAKLRRPSFWAKQIHICEEKQLIRSIHQRRCNPDFKTAHPAECRGNSEGDGLTVHPESKIRIIKEIQTKIKNANPPPVPHIPRFNRS